MSSDLRYKFRHFLYYNKFLFNWWEQTRKGYVWDKIKDVDIVVVGFDRSGNKTFRFKLNLAEIDTNYYDHNLFDLKEGVRLDKPVIILFREPLGVMSSKYLAWGSGFPLKSLLKEYYKFYHFCLKYQENVLFIDFADYVSSDFQKNIDRLNTKFRTSFYIPEIQIKTSDINKRLETVYPNKYEKTKREVVKQKLLKKYGGTRAYKRASFIYNEMLTRCKEQNIRLDLMKEVRDGVS